MNRPIIALVGGGARSGKSAFALEHARTLGPRRTLLATAEAQDAEMHARIAQHRRERGDDFATVEEAIAVPEAVRAMRDLDVVVIDCLTLWLSNLLLQDQPHAAIVERVDSLCDSLRASPFHSVVVTNEVGMGIVPESALGRAFRDLAGLAHQRIARCADQVYLAAVGCVLRLTPAPLELVAAGGVPCRA
ncbi:MAG TPA: bifunctional adenosylcobinamide kinase/adenosylcobinamide-phosphate guanylyltransferase [Polyangiales bacterium]|nr:bifunctional adenosylcobinamide kinase/adenosylcobinamide-phosphate guanylyltransferase [Polyangiales bacterium]